MPQVVSIKEHTYAQRVRPVGSRYEAEERFVPFLKLSGWARLAKTKTKRRSR